MLKTILRQENEHELEFTETKVIFVKEAPTEEIALVQTLALLSKIAIDPEFFRKLHIGGENLSGHFDASKCLDKSILEHFNAFYERKSQIEVK